MLTDDGDQGARHRQRRGSAAGGRSSGTRGRADWRRHGQHNGIIALFDRLPRPTFAEQVEGTKAFFRELNRLALTGVVDPGGNNLTPADYQALVQGLAGRRDDRPRRLQL